MSVAWSSRVALPGSRQSCGHAKCKWFTRAAAAVMIGAVVVEFGGAVLLPAAAPAVVVAAFAIFAAGIVLACWPHPAGGGIEDLIEAIRELSGQRLPNRWTDDDWADLERQLNR